MKITNTVWCKKVSSHLAMGHRCIEVNFGLAFNFICIICQAFAEEFKEILMPSIGSILEVELL
jgi:hypothetical protein